ERKLGLLSAQYRLSTHTLDRRIVDACAYLDEHVQERFTLRQWAAQAHMSPSHFGYLFNQVLGISPGKYLLEYRMQLAKELLIHTDYPIQEIARRVGYPDQGQFSRAFRNAVDNNPLSYRRHGLRNEGP
ncbi:MAG: AraC-type DNA-binding protein, partial [Paenibacillaceae bacterium]|nr:AraC-type DNA-binding protein [Paenibacillaceae bacterium]